jgi:Na+(H+)/acetate symporter ActP
LDPWRIIATIVASSVLASITDWLFMGVLFHDRYALHPEVWRGDRKDGRRILLSQLVGVIACVGFVWLCLLFPHLLRFYLKAAFAVWLAASVPMLIQNGVWMKLHPLILASHAVGWLVRFVITALVCSLLIPVG